MSDDMFSHYMRALDEVYRLRKLLAYEARVTEAHLDLKSFPKSRRHIAENQVVRMRKAATGDVQSHAHVEPTQLRRELVELGAETLTRFAWEAGDGS